jgi:hypothetical protein
MERRGEEDAGWVTNGENLQRSRLRVDARKWMAGKLRPRKYGDKVEIDHLSRDKSMTPTQILLVAPRHDDSTS